jgi:hypothetical protein
VLIIDVSMLLVKHVRHLVECLVGHAHRLIKGDIPWGPEKGVSQGNLRLLHNVIICYGQGGGSPRLGMQR